METTTKNGMELISRFDASDNLDGRTVYTVKLPDGKTCDVMRKHFPGFSNSGKPLTYVMEPHDLSRDEEIRVINFVKNEVPYDFIMLTLEVKFTYSYSAVRDTYFGPEQGLWNAEKRWEELKTEGRTDKLTTFRLMNGKRILRDFLEENRAECTL